MVSDELLQSGVEAYTGRKVTKLERFNDPEVAGAIALRVVMEDTGTIDFIITSQALTLRCAEDIAENLGECEFTTWPPKLGKPRFF